MSKPEAFTFLYRGRYCVTDTRYSREWTARYLRTLRACAHLRVTRRPGHVFQVFNRGHKPAVLAICPRS